MNILVTGAAGFIGYFTSLRLLKEGHRVVGIDNINDYYSTALKFDRLKQLGIAQVDAEQNNMRCHSEIYPQFNFYKIDIADADALEQLFERETFDVVCNLAAQAGVRYSIENPKAYVESNIVGFVNILECCRHHNINHLVYASSSSVYGQNEKIPFSTDDRVDHPISLYAASKKSNELMAHTYSHLYNFASTGLRFFTVYGPWGRPDMAYFLFCEAIRQQNPIKVFNKGKLERDFTYIDDIVEGIVRIILKDTAQREPYKLYNIGNNKSVNLLDFIDTIEKEMGKETAKEYVEMQAGDVYKTWADVDAFVAQQTNTAKIGLPNRKINVMVP
ncbi:MAG: NAD-dependent epimerase/dehydratase family protein, partial [Flavobacteriaceae bacterium]